MVRGNSIRLTAVALALWFVPAFGASVAVAADKPASVYQKTLKGTTMVVASDGQGSGWIVNKQKKLMITAEHVVGTDEKIKVYFPAFRAGKVISDRQFYENQQKPVIGRVLRVDTNRDLALVELEALPEGVNELKLADDAPEPGEAVHAVGCPGVSTGLWVYSYGKVRSLNQKRWIDSTRASRDARVVETQIPINPGDSGGPLVNDAGELVGVNSACAGNASLVSVSIEVAEIKQFLVAPPALTKPEQIEALFRKVEAAKRANNLKAAAEHLAAIIKLDKQNVKAFCEFAWLSNEQDNQDDAILFALAAVVIDKNCSNGWRELGYAHLKQKQWKEASQELLLAIKLDPTNWGCYDYLAVVLRAIDEDAAADEVLKIKAEMQQQQISKNS